MKTHLGLGSNLLPQVLCGSWISLNNSNLFATELVLTQIPVLVHCTRVICGHNEVINSHKQHKVQTLNTTSQGSSKIKLSPERLYL